MLHLLLIAIVLTPYAGAALREAMPLGGPAAVALGLGVLALPLGYAAAARRVARRLGQPGAARRVRRLERFNTLYLVAILLWLAAAIAAGWLETIRGVLGDGVWIDEAVATLPALALLFVQWWAYYPVDRRLRESALIRRLDAGGPVYALPSRGRYLLHQCRHHLALVLGPIWPLLAWSEWISRLAGEAGGAAVLSPVAATGLTVAGGLTVFLLAPLLVVRLWDTQPLPAGEVRRVLAGMCETAGVRVRELLVWRSDGGLVNAAVMGLVAPVRYVLLSDGLLDQVERPHVEAVMAHELGHVKKKHMPTLAIAAIGSLGLVEVGAWTAFDLLEPVTTRAGVAETATTTGIVVVAVMAWVALFGWVSRRIEREADVFAVRTVARQHAWEAAERREAQDEADSVTPGVTSPARRAHDQPTPRAAPSVITAAAAGQMIDALGRVAELARIDPGRRSWRHGSIAWRQAHLASLVGRPLDRLPIDRTMAVIRVAAVLALAATLALILLPVPAPSA